MQEVRIVPLWRKVAYALILVISLISIMLISHQNSEARFHQPPLQPLPIQNRVLTAENSDGQLLIYLESSQEKRLISQEDPNKVLPNQITLSPDNNWVSLVKIDNENDHFDLTGASIWLINSQTGMERLLIDASQEFLVTNPLWSSDSSRVAYAKVFPNRSISQTIIAELWITDLEGNETRLVDDESFGPAFFFGESFAVAWSVNGQAIQYFNEIGDERVYEVDIATGNIRLAQPPYAAPIEQYLQRIELSRQQGYSGITKPITGLPDYQGWSGGQYYSVAYLDDYYGSSWEGSGGHPGADITYGAGCPGSEVVSVADGVVWNSINTWQNNCHGGSSFGNFVIVRSDGLPAVNGYAGGTFYFLYGHLYDVSVIPGNFPIQRGDPIGHIGSTGTSSNPHLHFQLEPDLGQMHPWWFENGGCSIPDSCGINFQGPAMINTSNPMMFVQAHMATPGWGVTACEHNNLQGVCELFTVDDPFLDENPIDKLTISSLQLPEYWQAKLFQDKYFGGTSSNTYYGPTTVTASMLGAFNDQAESLRIGAPFCRPGDPPRPSVVDEIPLLEDCSPEADGAAFISDVTIPDGTVVSPGQNLVKTWRIRNTGSTDWGTGYQLVFIGGEQMGAPGAVSVPVTAPDQEVDISINLTAPSTGGDHVGYWRLRNPQGTYFGQTIWVSIEVEDDSNPPPPPSGFSLTCTNCPATVEPGTIFRPTLRATVGSGQLLEGRGDMVRHKGGGLFGAFLHVAVVGVVNQGQSYDFTFYADHPITAPTTEGTYQSIWQLWQNGQWVGPEYEIQFQVQAGGGSNHPPNAPTLTGPGDWAVYYGNTGIVLTAQQNGDPDGDPVNEYYFEIFGSQANQNSGWISSNSWSPSGLPFGGYQWHVKVRDSHQAESSWSNQVWHFNLINNDPEIYSFYAMACWDAWGGPEKICFCANTNAGTLRVQVNDAADGSANGEWHILNELGVPEYECDSEDDRPPNWDQLEGETGTHLVRLYARREGGWENAATADITVSLPPNRRPNSPRNLLPIWDSFVNELDIHFDWDDSLRTSSYHLEVSQANDFNTLLVDQTLPYGTTEYDYSLPSAYENVYWRVTAIGPYGTNTSEGRFHPDITPPVSSMTQLPPVTTETVFNVNWSGTDTRSGLRWYHVQAREGDRPESQWEDWLVNTTQTAALFLGQPGHEYYFRVRAMDKVGNWEAWPVGDGDTHTLIDLSAAPPTPWWNTNYTWRRNLVMLNNDGDVIPTHYPMHIHFDNTTTPTATDIYNASTSSIKGDDVRIVYDNQTELHRFVQRFTADEIDIWFPLQVPLSGGQTDNTSYQIYYGYASAVNPPANINNVFLPTTDANTMGLWHFQDGSGNTVIDSSGRSHNGNFSNGGWGDGLLGWTGIFNGVNSSVDVGNSTDFDFNAFTAEAWIYLNDVSTGNWPLIISKKHEGGPGGFEIRINNDRKIFFYMSGNTMTSYDPIQPNQWYHLAAVFNGSNQVTLYLNGVVAGSQSNFSSPSANSDPLLIGYGTYVQNPVSFPGMIQHVRVSNIARSDFPYARVDIPASVAAGTATSQPGSGTADLVILELSAYPNPTGGVLIQALVENQGELSTQNGFFTDLYLDHIPTGAGDYSGSIQFWVNTSIQPGATLTLTAVLNDLSQLNHGIMQANSPMAEVDGLLYAQADSTGVISESNNNNNIYTNGLNICVAIADVFEFDNTRFAATPVQWDTLQTHNFHTMGDEDWFAIPAVANQTYTITTVNLGSHADTYLHVYGTNGTTLIASNDDYGGTLASRVEWTAPTTGTYYVMVRHWNPNASGCGTQYTVLFGNARLYLPLVLRP